MPYKSAKGAKVGDITANRGQLVETPLDELMESVQGRAERCLVYVTKSGGADIMILLRG
jgi:hypothetical protein